MESKKDFSIVDIFTSRRTITTVISVVIMAVIAFAFFYPDVTEGNVLSQHDTQQGIANGEEALKFKETTGETTRWTNSLFSGMPTFQISPSYKSTGLLEWVNTVMGLGMPSPANLIFMMMVGFFILMLSFKMKWYVAVLGGIAYGFSSYFFIIIGAGHIWKFVTLAYVPPTIAGIVWAYRGKYLTGSALAALFAAMQISWNHVQMTYYFLFVIVALVIAFLVEAIRKGTVKQWGIASGALLVAGMLAVAANLPNLYNTYEYGKETMRGGHSELTAEGGNNASSNGLDKDYITAWSYGKAETWSLLIPNVCGGASIRPEKGNNVPMTLDKTDKAKSMLANGEISSDIYQFLGNPSQCPFLQYFGDQPMTNGPVYVGAIIFALFLLGCAVVKGPVKWALVVSTILSLFIAWGHNMMWFTDFMIDYFPLYNKFRTVASGLVIAEFTIPLLAMLALNKAFTEKDFFAKNKVAVYASFGIPAAICAAVWLMPSIFKVFSNMEYTYYIESGQLQSVPEIQIAVEAIRSSLIASDAMRSLIFIALGFAALWVYLKGYTKVAVSAGALSVLILVDLFAVNKRYLSHDCFMPAVEQASKFEPRPADKQILQDKDPNYRVLDVNHFGDAMPSYFHKHIGGYHAAKLTRYQDLIERQITRNNNEVINMLNTKYYIIDDNTAQLNPDALGNAWFVDTLQYVSNANEEMAFLNNFHAATQAVADAKFKTALGDAKPVTEGDKIVETSYAPNRLTYHSKSQNGGLAVFSEIYFPWGWKATIDGKEAQIGRVNYVLRALNVPAGEHDIEFTFKPQSVETTDNVATVAIIAIYLLLLAAINVAILRRLKEGKTEKADDKN